MTNLGGRTLSHYRLEVKIGAGGMGEVHRGIDTRLNRPVAVKILPADLLQDDDRLRRFTQEAKAASALNHPNIVTIYDIGSEAGIDFIVMEHVAGKTLEEMIGRRPMPITTLLRYATQIADALTAAHAAGIVHRDLKPTNVMVTDQGLVKVLDFGLAKLTEVSPTAGDHTRTEAQLGSPTEPGMIVGTASYMSPEQAEGATVDARSDIFSFGSVLYEMATGRRAFEGSTTMSTIAAVLRDDPRPISTITAPLPHDLEVLINRCLKKDPTRRVQHMADLKVALQELKEDSESGRLMTSVSSAPAVTARRPRWPVAVAALAGVVAVAAVTGWILLGRRAPGPPQPSALTRLTFDSGMTTQPALSPDGKLIAYVSDRATKMPNLWVQQVDGGQAVQLTRHEGGAVFPSFSPDGTWITYMVPPGKQDEGIYVVSTIGGEPRKIASKGDAPRFSPDGRQLSFSLSEGTSSRLMLVPATGGQPRKVDGELTIVSPLSVWSPDGSHLLTLGRVDPKGPATDTIDWFAIALKDGNVVRTGASAALKAQKVLQDTGIMPAPNDWTGGAVFFTVQNRDAANVWRVGVDPATFQLTGPADRLTSGTAQEISPTVSRDGKLAFAAVDTIQDYWALPIDANAALVKGPRTQIMKNSASDNQALSLDGNTLLYCSHRGGQSEFRSRDLRSGKETLLVSSATDQHLSSTTADGTAFMYSVPGRVQAQFLGTTSGAPPRKLCENCGHSTLSKDGTKHLHIIEPDHHTYRLLDIASGRSTELVSSPTKEFGYSQFSPNDQWLAITTLTSEEMFLVPVRTTKVDEKEMIPIGRLSSPGGYQMFRFSPDGNTIYYVSLEDGNSCIYAQRLAANRHPAGAPVVVQHLHEANTWGHPHGMRVGADKIVLLMNQGTSNIWLTQPRP
jgi:Tol biopolymer transport system component